MKETTRTILLITALFSLTQSSPVEKKLMPNFKLSGFAQGTTYQVSYFAQDSLVTGSDVDLILAGIDSSLSLYKSYSTISRFNSSPSGSKIDDHFKKVFLKSAEVTRHTGGLFDITVQPLVQAWGFGSAKAAVVPDSASIKSTLKCVGAEKVKLNNNILFKSLPCVKIDMNGIAQGYSVDVIADFLQSKNINDFMVELGGEIRVEGRKATGGLFTIGIETPDDSHNAGRPLQRILKIKAGAITTSGNYRNYHASGAKRFSHIINPKTGFPEESELISVTVHAPDAITADAYDNALMLMGVEKALAFVEATDDLAAYFIYRKRDGTIADTACAKFEKLLNQQ
ncbi:FAD:protein FMN transferase [Arcticibacter sp.]|uniref:FAD:protein FMN transferase n=1 Tax=Arcticibacter sp. TaxID=1872630 RepID=UPI003890A42A